MFQVCIIKTLRNTTDGDVDISIDNSKFTLFLSLLFYPFLCEIKS